MKGTSTLIIGFALFAVLIGYISGISDSEISKTLLAALFAFMGGKIFIDITGKPEQEQKFSGKILIAFSIMFFIGLNIGIYIKVNRVLTRHEQQDAVSDISYLKDFKVERTLIDKYYLGELPADTLLQKILNSNP